MIQRNAGRSNDTEVVPPLKNSDTRQTSAEVSQEDVVDFSRSSNPTRVDAPNLILSDTELRYHPLWEVRRNNIFCYVCEAFWNAGTDRPLTEAKLSAEFVDPKRSYAMDVETLRKATDHVSEVAAQYGVLKVLIPVHFATLADAEAAETYTQVCGNCARSVIDNIYFEIIKPPAPVSRYLYLRTAERIRPFGQEIMLRVEPDFNQFEEIPTEEFLSVGLGLRANARREQDIITELERFSLNAVSRGIRTHVHGIDSVSLSAIIMRLGFDFIGSDCIHQPLEMSEPQGEFATPDELLKSLLTSKRVK